MIYIAILLVICFILFYLKSPSVKGQISEEFLAHTLDIKKETQYGGKILRNIYVPAPNGNTTEIDVLYITRKGIFVFENKNYAGYIFGNENNKNWTVTLYAGRKGFRTKVKKYHFYNPVRQNHTHIKFLKLFLGFNVKTFSIITFSNRSELKSININSTDVFVCNHANLSNILRNIWENNLDILTEIQINDIYNKLLPITIVNKEQKQQHVSNIHHGLNNTYICPLCGGQLIIRTATRGANAGNQFYGCSNYPKCRYIKNIDIKNKNV